MSLVGTLNEILQGLKRIAISGCLRCITQFFYNQSRFTIIDGFKFLITAVRINKVVYPVTNFHQNRFRRRTEYPVERVRHLCIFREIRVFGQCHDDCMNALYIFRRKGKALKGIFGMYAGVWSAVFENIVEPCGKDCDVATTKM